MMRQNKWKMLISSLVIMLPILAGLLLWDRLPEQMAIHWGADGAIDGWQGRVTAVFALPCILLVVHWLCIGVTSLDPNSKTQSRKALGILFWIIPVISLCANGVIYATAFGMELSMDRFFLPLLGFMFLIMGNYMPKFSQNYTMGIKVKWALENQENWNATHRFGGRLWVVGGLVMIACMFLPEDEWIAWVLVVLMLGLAMAPVVYSYVYHRKQLRAGTATVDRPSIPMLPHGKTIRMISLILIVVIVIAVLVLMFTGDIRVECREDTFTIKASYWQDLTIAYDAIDSIEYREARVSASRTNGFGSARLLMGTFRNEEFGYFTRYTYTDCDAAIVLNVNGKVLVISGADPYQTEEIYQSLLDRWAK